VPNIGLSELVVLLMILVLVFGASRLPALGDGLGRAIRGFKRGMANDDRIAVNKDEAGTLPARDAVKPTPPTDAEDAELVDRKS
jgi:sec-independent protein translocase protein TatA